MAQKSRVGTQTASLCSTWLTSRFRLSCMSIVENHRGCYISFIKPLYKTSLGKDHLFSHSQQSIQAFSTSGGFLQDTGLILYGVTLVKWTLHDMTLHAPDCEQQFHEVKNNECRPRRLGPPKLRKSVNRTWDSSWEEDNWDWEPEKEQRPGLRP